MQAAPFTGNGGSELFDEPFYGLGLLAFVKAGRHFSRSILERIITKPVDSKPSRYNLSGLIEAGRRSERAHVDSLKGLTGCLSQERRSLV